MQLYKVTFHPRRRRPVAVTVAAAREAGIVERSVADLNLAIRAATAAKQR